MSDDNQKDEKKLAPSELADLMREWRKRYDSLPLTEMAVELVQLRAKKDEVEKQLSKAKAELEFLSKTIIPDTMHDQHVSKISVTGVGTMYLQGDVYVRTLGDKQALFAFLRESGNESLITEVVQSSTLKAWAKEQVKQGVELPDDLLQVQPYSFAKVLKK